MKYGLYYFKNTINLGDDMWAYAQSLFYPHIDYLIDNTTVYKFKAENNETVASIFSAFIEPYNYEYSFLPPTNIVPLFIGSYFRPTMFEFLDVPLIKSYLKKHSPIGCRTKELAELFDSKNISAYFSGCITLTLPDLKLEKEKYICLVDVPQYVVDYVKKKVAGKYELKILSHNIDNVSKHSALSIQERFELVKNNLEIYAKAHCVVTSRLHVALPCLTQNTPVLLVVPNEKMDGVNDIERRLQDYLPFLNHSFNSDFCEDSVAYDFVNPPSNPDVYKLFRDNLIEKCNSFINNCETGNVQQSFSSEAEELQKNELIDVLQCKLQQLKSVIDGKNAVISDLKEKTVAQREGILSLQKRLREYETFNEWENVEYFGDWEARSLFMSKFISSQCHSLLDLGCGEMHIRKFLPDGIKYYGCDYKKREESTIVCDLAKGEFPELSVDTIFIAGVLEYLTNWDEVLAKCAQHCKQIILSYSTIESAVNRDPIWVNALSRNEIINSALSNGFRLVNKETFNTSDIFNFIKV